MGFTPKNKRFGSKPEGSSDRTLSRATCGSCGASCTVPFRPSAGKPVYCNDCFRKDSADFSDRRSPGRFNRDSRVTSRGARPDHRRPGVTLEQINDKLDKILKLLEDQ